MPVADQDRVSQIILNTKNDKMKLALERAERASESDAAIMLIGESGVGKELFARYVHAHSKRRSKAIVAVNCPALTESLLESELFGHEKGAFTGAIKQQKGKFEQGDGGSIFLDEIGDLSTSAQAKLLRVIEYKEFDRVGGESPVRVDVRLITATNKDLGELIGQGKFRHDLFYRINEITIDIPPLRERREDVLLLAEAFIEEFNALTGKNIQKVGDATTKVLLAYDWPGNVRELKAVIKRGVTLADPDRDTLWVEDLGMHVSFRSPVPGSPLSRDLSLEAAERKHVELVLKLTGYNKSRSAELLKISRPTLDKKIQDYRIEIPDL
jgi:transcriptional regulator with PAS, ATPase and Fis domain